MAIERLALPGVSPAVDDQDRVGFFGLILGKRGRSVNGGGDAEPLEVDTVPRAFSHLPRHHSPIAGDENLGIREARAGEDVGGACLNVSPRMPAALAVAAARPKQHETQG